MSKRHIISLHVWVPAEKFFFSQSYELGHLTCKKFPHVEIRPKRGSSCISLFKLIYINFNKLRWYLQHAILQSFYLWRQRKINCNLLWIFIYLLNLFRFIQQRPYEQDTMRGRFESLSCHNVISYLKRARDGHLTHK